MTSLLEVSNLKTYFRDKRQTIPAVDGMDLTIKEGEIVALVGESGSGKSITSLSIMGLIPKPGGEIVDGNITFNGINLLEQNEKGMQKIRGSEIAMIFQDPMTSLNPTLTIGEQIIEVITFHQKVKKKEARKKAMELLETVGFARVEEIFYEYPHRLSGGMRQRVMIAIAMSCNPKLLIADEPTTALDVTIQAQILDLMRDLAKKMNTAILLITHDLGVVSEMADRVIVMYGGQTVEEAPIDDLFEEPLHPYTKGLIDSVPSIEEAIEKLNTIPGNVPAPDEMPTGCRFAPRCSLASERCFKEQPTLLRMESGRSVRCLLHERGINGERNSSSGAGER